MGHSGGKRIEELVFGLHFFGLDQFGHVADGQHLTLFAPKHEVAVAQPKELL